jgi:hypothetical protein
MQGKILAAENFAFLEKIMLVNGSATPPRASFISRRGVDEPLAVTSDIHASSLLARTQARLP